MSTFPPVLGCVYANELCVYKCIRVRDSSASAEEEKPLKCRAMKITLRKSIKRFSLSLPLLFLSTDIFSFFSCCGGFSSDIFLSHTFFTPPFFPSLLWHGKFSISNPERGLATFEFGIYKTASVNRLRGDVGCRSSS